MASACPLPARQTRPLDDDAAWLDLSDGANDVVATAYLPRASGFGVMLTSHAAVSSATIRRLAPEGRFDAPEATGGISDSQGRTPYVLFAPPDETTGRPASMPSPSPGPMRPARTRAPGTWSSRPGAG